jgi:hypothetical protein
MPHHRMLAPPGARSASSRAARGSLPHGSRREGAVFAVVDAAEAGRAHSVRWRWRADEWRRRSGGEDVACGVGGFPGSLLCCPPRMYRGCESTLEVSRDAAFSRPRKIIPSTHISRRCWSVQIALARGKLAVKYSCRWRWSNKILKLYNFHFQILHIIMFGIVVTLPVQRTGMFPNE